MKELDVRVVTCFDCKDRFKVTAGSVSSIVSRAGWFREGKVVGAKVLCPTCRNSIVLSDVPEWFLKKLQRDYEDYCRVVWVRPNMPVFHS